jgi:hypothetical protein
MNLSAASFLSVFAASSLVAQSVPDANAIPNWPVAASWSPPQRSGGIHTMTDLAPAIPFVPITPCRVADTRGNGFTDQAGPPALAANTTRAFRTNGVVPGIPEQCGIPLNADALSFQFTIVQPTTDGNLIAWPSGTTPPTASVLNWSAGITALGNGTIVPVFSDFPIVAPHLAVRINTPPGGSAHLVIDVNGYFADVQNSGHYFHVVGNSAWPASVLHAGNNGTGSGGRFQSAGGASNSSGVVGVTSPNPTIAGPYNPAGVRGESSGYGVLGVSSNEGVAGSLVTGAGAELVYGSLGLAVGTDPTCPSTPCGGPWGVFAGGNLGATGTKHFLDPHPDDPKLAIAYISLEGPEAGTYFRGRARFQNGMARIAVPEHFRLVTDPEGLTVQITPIGGLATVGVVRADLHEIVVQASRNLEFSYLVHGVRSTFKDVNPVRALGDFMPRSADAKLPLWLSPAQKRVLIENGTYNADGTVNTETARRLGWDRMWEERNRPAPQPE